MRRSDFGAGGTRTILTLAFLAALVYLAVQVIPIYVHSYELQDYLGQLAVQATVNRASPEAIRINVVAHARDLGFSVDPRNVKVTATNKVTIDVEYWVPVDLKVYTWSLHFTPSAENRAL